MSKSASASELDPWTISKRRHHSGWRRFRRPRATSVASAARASHRPRAARWTSQHRYGARRRGRPEAKSESLRMRSCCDTADWVMPNARLITATMSPDVCSPARAVQECGGRRVAEDVEGLHWLRASPLRLVDVEGRGAGLLRITGNRGLAPCLAARPLEILALLRRRPCHGLSPVDRRAGRKTSAECHQRQVQSDPKNLPPDGRDAPVRAACHRPDRWRINLRSGTP